MVGKKVRIVENLDDHVGYKGEVLTVKTVEIDSYITVEEGDWYIGLEEVEFI